MAPSLMEFLRENVLNTTTMVKVDSGTGLAQYLFDRNVDAPYASNGYASTTATVLSIELSSPRVLTHMLLQNHNLKDFRVFYDSVTANSLAIVSGNAQPNTYLEWPSVTVSSIQLQINEAMTPEERSIGELIITERRLAFERNPSAADYKHQIYRKQIEHEMPDGGTAIFNIKNKFQADIEWDFITTVFHNSLLEVFNEAEPIYFVPFPSTTAWDGRAYEVVWVGGFNFRYGTNDREQGFSGGLRIKETPSA